MMNGYEYTDMDAILAGSFRAAIYCRLSKDDDLDGESASIANQRDMLEKYCEKQGWEVVAVYQDDGYTGLNMERPDLKRMLKAIERRQINLVITKDLSRLGRNYLQTGTLIEDFFPRHGVRYIAMNDGIDTMRENNDIAPFKNILNEMYSKDISKKVHSSYLLKAQQGQFTGCIAPFGYQKDPEDKNHLLVDEETAPIVRQIFRWALEGHGPNFIRRRLEEQKVPCPTWWNRERGFRNVRTKWEKKDPVNGRYMWDFSVIKDILMNPVYTGAIASQKKDYRFKIGTIGEKKPQDWIVVEERHEPIVDRKSFDIVQDKLKSRQRSRQTGEISLFAGLLKCGECGKSLTIRYTNDKHPKQIYSCKTYYHLEDKRIAINEGMSELQTLKTAIHEIAHAKLHDIDLNAPKDEQQPHVDRRTREVEAESVAYTVCQHYGLDTSDYSFGYVAGWSSGRELSELKSSLETIRSAAAEIINSIDENLAELQKAQDKEQTAGQEQPTREGQEAAPEKPEPEAAAPGKSGAQEKAGAAPKEAFTPETIYRVRRNLYSDSRENSYLLQAYVTQENGRAKMGDVLYTGTPEKCRELMGQLKSGELTEGDVKQLYAKAQETAQTAGQDKDTFSIYQIKGGDETRDFRFEPYDRLQAAGNVVDRANYELVYSAPLAPETSLEDIYTRFNIDHPKDFKGHSLSVSDVVVLHQNGQDTAHYVDSVGFRQVPEFLQEQKQLTPDELTTGETIQTPRGTFHVTAMSREQIEAAGYGFHHQSDDGKYLIMGNGTRAFAVAAEQAQRDNPLKTAEQTTEQNGNMIDGIINNTPTVDELEAKVKAGEQISLVDLANAVKADKERGKGAKPEKKPSIRAQLRADKEKAQKKNAKQKSQDLERS